MSEAVAQEPLFEANLTFPTFVNEVAFWQDAGTHLYERFTNEAADATNPVALAEMIEAEYPVKLPDDEDRQYQIFEALAEIHAAQVGVQGYRGVWIKERL